MYYKVSLVPIYGERHRLLPSFSGSVVAFPVFQPRALEMVRQARILSATSSPLFACNFRLYSTTENCEFIKQLFLPKKHFPGIEYCHRDILGVIRILTENSMRVSELLNIRNKDVLQGNRFLVHGLKRSRSYAVVIPGSWICQPPDSDPRWQSAVIPFTYNTIYRWCVKLDFGIRIGSQKVEHRTHAHRYFTAKRSLEIAGKQCARDLLHHNSHRAIEAYIQ